MAWYDRRGYAAAVDALPAGVGVDQHIADLLGVLEGRRAVLVGHSFGGVTVLGTAIKAPDQVRAVVLYETGLAWIPGWDDRTLSQLLWGQAPEEAAARLMFRERWPEMAADQRALRMLEARAFVAEERSVRTGEPPFDLSDLRAPLVYGCGDAHPFSVVRDHLRRTVDQLEVVELLGAGHNAHRTRPDAFADMVRRGLALANA
jgi:pimeloyl-ACP methyl ester carboxylesterase